MKELFDNYLWQGDCLRLMSNIPDKSIRLILCDLPYGKTKNPWDKIIPMTPLWEQYRRLIVDNGAIVLFGEGAFSAKLICSNEGMYRYSWIWEKPNPKGFLNANRMPLKAHEDLLVFYKKLPVYNPQKTTGHSRKISTSRHRRNSKMSNNYGHYIPNSYDSTERFPRSVLRFKSDTQLSKLHSTQKPLALVKYMIKTYSNPGDWVLDNACGSNTTGLGCADLGRNYIGIENDPGIYLDAKRRVEDHPNINFQTDTNERVHPRH